MKLKDLRKKHNLDQKDLAKILGVSQSKISDLENGILELKISELAKLKTALNITWNYFDELLMDKSNYKSKYK